MVSAFRVKYTLSDATALRMTILPACQTIGQLIASIAQKERADVDTVSLEGCILNEDESLDAFSDSPNQIFAFLKSASRPAITIYRRQSAQSPLCQKPPSIIQPMSAYVRDFRGFEKIRVIGKGAFGKVKLLEDPSAHELIAIKFSDSETPQARDRSAAFVREIDALFLHVSDNSQIPTSTTS
jgi:hypothetical protein